MDSNKRNDRPRVGIAVMVFKDGSVLLGRRKASHGRDCWAFPGGHLEFGEEIDDCARREVLEETGLAVDNLRIRAVTNDIWTETQSHYVTLFVLANYVSGIPEVREPEKSESWQWFRWTELPQPLFLPIRNLIKQGLDLESLVAQGLLIGSASNKN